MACNLHNSFVRTPLWVFLDSMESSLSLESNHMLFNGICVSNSALGLLYGHGILTIYENLLL